jgi:SAM-dependent methyltransferase
MSLGATAPTALRAEPDVFEALLPLDGARILELGCGRAEFTRRIARTGRDRRVLALEVDVVQHALNAATGDLPNVEFRLGGAEAIPAPDASFDVALMFKSLHHVPVALMPRSLEEIRRVLVPGGLLYVSEPVYAGDFNDIVRLFHDERAVRQAAFDAVRAAVGAGRFELVGQTFFDAPVRFADFADFEAKVIGVTHTRHVLTPTVLAEVRSRIEARRSADGLRFTQPLRVDLLRRPAGS